jgi:hypothetical protein
MKATITQRTEPVACHYAFGFLDSAGREYGMASLCWEVDVTEQVEKTGVYYTSFDAPGHYFAASTQATRDGKSYGASQDSRYFKTEEEREAYLVRRKADSLKAAEKKGIPRRVNLRLTINVEM